jgi:hypothetical protein
MKWIMLFLNGMIVLGIVFSMLLYGFLIYDELKWEAADQQWKHALQQEIQ